MRIKVACTSGQKWSYSLVNYLTIFKLFLKKFRAYFYEASDKSCQKMNRNSEVLISFLELNPCER